MIVKRSRHVMIDSWALLVIGWTCLGAGSQYCGSAPLIATAQTLNPNDISTNRMSALMERTCRTWRPQRRQRWIYVHVTEGAEGSTDVWIDGSTCCWTHRLHMLPHVLVNNLYWHVDMLSQVCHGCLSQVDTSWRCWFVPLRVSEVSLCLVGGSESRGGHSCTARQRRLN